MSIHSHNIAIDAAAWDSPWRQRRVGEKVLLSLALVLTALLSDPWPGCILVAAVALGLMLGPARIRPLLVLGVMSAPAAFLLIGTLPVAATWNGMRDLAWGILGWSHGGFAFGPLRITPEGLARAGALWAHSLSGTLGVILLATTTPMVDLMGWLRHLRIPDPLIEIASLTYRLLFLLLGTTLAIREAQHARLGDVASWRRRWSIIASALGSVLLTTWERATRLQAGLEGRGYEDALLTLNPTSTRSWSFILMGAACLALIWSSSLAWTLWSPR